MSIAGRLLLAKQACLSSTRRHLDLQNAQSKGPYATTHVLGTFGGPGMSRDPHRCPTEEAGIGIALSFLAGYHHPGRCLDLQD